MNSLRSVSISRRLWLILIVAVVMLLTLGVLMLKQIHDDLYHAKAQKTQHVVQTASGLLTYYHDLETAGTLSKDAAQKQALTAIRGLRYDQSDYFWINDLDGTITDGGELTHSYSSEGEVKMTKQDHNTQHKHTTNTTTMVADPLAPPATWI